MPASRVGGDGCVAALAEVPELPEVAEALAASEASLSAVLKQRAADYRARQGKRVRFGRATPPEAGDADDDIAAELAVAAALVERWDEGAPPAVTEDSRPGMSAPQGAEEMTVVGDEREALTVAVPTASTTVTVSWRVLLLSGPAGAGKASVALRLGGRLAKAVTVRIEPLRERNYRSVVAMVVPPEGSAVGSPVVPAMWSGPALDARDKALDLIHAYLADGYHVIVDDVLESPADVRTYLDALGGVTVQPVSLMPSLDEMERRDKMRPEADQIGLRMNEVRQAMMRQLDEVSLVLDTSADTVDETVQRLLAASAA